MGTAKSYQPVDKCFAGATLICLGSGPSLTQADVNLIQGRATVIAVNDTYRLAPWADVLYSCDAKWWHWHKGVPEFGGMKFSISPGASKYGVRILRDTGQKGLELDPTGLRTGHNSGYQAINLAVHLGAARIVLLGYDMHGDHFFGSHRDNTRPPFALCLKRFQTLVEPLKLMGIDVINATRTTALTVFPREPLESLFSEAA